MSGVELGLAIAGLVSTGAMPLLASALSRFRRSRRLRKLAESRQRPGRADAISLRNLKKLESWLEKERRWNERERMEERRWSDRKWMDEERMCEQQERIEGMLVLLPELIETMMVMREGRSGLYRSTMQEHHEPWIAWEEYRWPCCMEGYDGYARY